MDEAVLPYIGVIGTVSPWGIIGLGIVSIWRGWWIAKPIHDAIVKALETRVAQEVEAKEKAYEANDLLRDQLLKYVREDSLALTALTGIREEARKS